MKKNLIILQHTGLGDHIICNGLVRIIVKNNPEKNVSLVVYNQNLNNVKRMFQDLNDLNFIPIDMNGFHHSQFRDTDDTDVLKIGFEKVRIEEFDKSFYDSANIPFMERWNSFFIERDLDSEERLYNSLNITDDYIFVHDSASENSYNLNIESNLRQIRLEKNEHEKSIFDWIKVIECAKEIHVVNSCVVHLVDSINPKGKLYFHDVHHPQYRFHTTKQWEVKV